MFTKVERRQGNYWKKTLFLPHSVNIKNYSRKEQLYFLYFLNSMLIYFVPKIDSKIKQSGIAIELPNKI